MDFLLSSKEVLKKNGYKLTHARLKLLEALSSSEAPLDAYQLADNLKLPASTIYRNLEVLLENDLIHFIKENRSYVPCKIHDKNDVDNSRCHHQFICKICKRAFGLTPDDRDFIKYLQKLYPNFVFEDHYFEFMGVCNSCNKNTIC